MNALMRSDLVPSLYPAPLHMHAIGCAAGYETPPPIWGGRRAEHYHAV